MPGRTTVTHVPMHLGISTPRAPLSAAWPLLQADGVMIAYDVGRRSSYERALEYWADQVELHAASHVSVVLVGTKTDLAAAAPAYRQVRVEEARAAAQQRGWEWYETSACTGAHVGEAFYLLACSVVNAHNDAQEAAGADGKRVGLDARQQGHEGGCAC